MGKYFQMLCLANKSTFVPGAALLSQTKEALASITVLTSLSPGCIAAGLSRSALCPYVTYGSSMLSRACSILRLWLYATCKLCLFQSYFVSVEHVGNDPSKDMLAVASTLSPQSLCTVASWDMMGYLREGKDLPHQRPVVSLKHPLDLSPNLYNIPLGEQKFHRTILTWGGLHHCPSGAWLFPEVRYLTQRRKVGGPGFPPLPTSTLPRSNQSDNSFVALDRACVCFSELLIFF